MIEDVFRLAEEAIEKKDLVGAVAARKAMIFWGREEQFNEEALVTRYQEIYKSINNFIDTGDFRVYREK